MIDASLLRPDLRSRVRKPFGIDGNLRVPAVTECDKHAPEIDTARRAAGW